MESSAGILEEPRGQTIRNCVIHYACAIVLKAAIRVFMLTTPTMDMIMFDDAGDAGASDDAKGDDADNDEDIHYYGARGVGDDVCAAQYAYHRLRRPRPSGTSALYQHATHGSRELWETREII